MAFIPNPIVVEQTNRGVFQYDIYSRLLKDRIVVLGTEISDAVANVIVGQLLFLDADDPDKDINLYINSPGGAVDDTLAIFDTMRFLSCDVATYCIGKAMSGGAIILAAGIKGKRFILPHAKVMIHQPYGGIYGQAADIQIQAEEILKSKKILNNMLAELTGQSVERVAEDSERDKYFDANEAKTYGLVDEVLELKKVKPPESTPPEANSPDSKTPDGKSPGAK